MFYTHKISPSERARHVIEMNLSLLRPLGIEENRPVEFPVGLEAEDRRRASDFFESLGWGPEVPVAALYPGAGWETKRWGVEKFAALGDRLSKETGAKILVVWGPGEEDLVKALRGNLREPAHMIPATSVREMAAFLERCQLFVGGDTGPLHLAAALGVPTVAIVGPTTPARNGPCGPAGVRGSVVHLELPCSHCYQRTCPGFGTRCLTETSVDEVAEAALATWNRGNPRAGVGTAAQEELFH
jgi:ADP-heptose:LPS heptosyltransferase